MLAVRDLPSAAVVAVITAVPGTAAVVVPVLVFAVASAGAAVAALFELTVSAGLQASSPTRHFPSLLLLRPNHPYSPSHD